MTSFKNAFIRISCLSLSLALIACGSRKEKTSEEMIEGAPFRVDSIGVDAVTASKLDTTGLPSAKTYYFKACLQDSVLRAPILYTQFLVSDGKESKSIRTDVSGCLLWTEVHPIDPLQAETIYKVKRTIIGKETFEGSVSLDLAFNPSNDGAAVADLRKTTPAFKMVETKAFTFSEQATGQTEALAIYRAKLNAATLTLSDAETNFEKYKVTKLLGLRWARNYKLSVSPAALRVKIDGTTESVDLPSGKYRVQFLLVRFDAKAPYKPADVITGFDQVVENSKLNFRPTVTLTLEDPSLVISRTRALVKISAEGEAQNRIQATYFDGVVAPLKGGDAAITLQAKNEELAGLFSGGAAESGNFERVESESGLALFVKNSGYSSADLTPLDSRKMLIPGNSFQYDLANQVAGFLENKLNKEQSDILMRALCFRTFEYEYLNPKPSIQGFVQELAGGPRLLTGNMHTCFDSPGSRINVDIKEFVVAINNSTPKLVGFPQDFSLAVSNSITFSDGKSDTTSTSHTTSFNASLGKTFSAPLPIDLSIGGSYSYAIARSIGTSKGTASSTSATMSSGQTLVATAETYEIDTEVKRCLLFSAKPEFHSAMSRNPNHSGFMVCSAKTAKKIARETYYIIDQPVASTVTRDGDSPTATRWRMKIRGTEQFELFKNVIANPNIVMEFQVRSEKVTADNLPREFRTVQVYPGMLSQ